MFEWVQIESPTGRPHVTLRACVPHVIMCYLWTIDGVVRHTRSLHMLSDTHAGSQWRTHTFRYCHSTKYKVCKCHADTL